MTKAELLAAIASAPDDAIVVVDVGGFGITRGVTTASAYKDMHFGTPPRFQWLVVLEIPADESDEEEAA